MNAKQATNNTNNENEVEIVAAVRVLYKMER